MRLGFVGTGNITAAMVTGFCTATEKPTRVLVSPRNAGTAARLAAAFPGIVEVASDNQAVLDGSDWVVLAVRPPISREVIGGLRFRPDHRVVSVIATLGPAELARLAAPAVRVVRANPLPTVAGHVGPIPLCPDDAETAALFGRIGTVVAVAQAAEFDRLIATTSLISTFFKLEDVAAGWLTDQGVASAQGRRFIAAMFHALARQADGCDEDFAAMSAEAATPGGLNEQVVRELTEAGSFDPIGPSLDRILTRIEGR